MERGGQRDSLATAVNKELDHFSDGNPPDCLSEGRAGVEFLAVHPEDDIAFVHNPAARAVESATTATTNAPRSTCRLRSSLSWALIME